MENYYHSVIDCGIKNNTHNLLSFIEIYGHRDIGNFSLPKSSIIWQIDNKNIKGLLLIPKIYNTIPFLQNTSINEKQLKVHYYTDEDITQDNNYFWITLVNLYKISSTNLLHIPINDKQACHILQQLISYCKNEELLLPKFIALHQSCMCTTGIDFTQVLLNGYTIVVDENLNDYVMLKHMTRIIQKQKRHQNPFIRNQEEILLTEQKQIIIEKKNIYILVLAYDITDIERWIWGKYILHLCWQIKKTKHSRINLIVKCCGRPLDIGTTSKIFSDEQRKPDIIIAQQYSISNAQQLCEFLHIPLVLVVYDISQYLHFYPIEKANDTTIKPSLIFCWTKYVFDQFQAHFIKLKQNPDCNKSKHYDTPLINLENGNNMNWLQETKNEEINPWWNIILYKVSIIIPCHSRHIDYLERCLNNICDFTEKPYEVIISASINPHEDNVQEKFQLLNCLKNKFQDKQNLNIHFSLDKLTASQNRNLAAQQSHGDILLALDADDEYHVQLLEIILYMWRKFCPVELHWGFEIESNVFDKNHIIEDLSSIPLVPGEVVHQLHHPNHRFLYILTGHSQVVSPPIAFGHTALSKDVWQQLPWPDCMYIEDVLMHRSICWQYPQQSLWIVYALSLYHKNCSLRQ